MARKHSRKSLYSPGSILRKVTHVNCRHDFQFRRWVCTFVGVGNEGTGRKVYGVGKTLDASMKDGLKNMRHKVTYPVKQR